MMSLTSLFAVVPPPLAAIAHDPSHAAGYAHGLLVGGIAGLFLGGTFGMLVMACLVASRPDQPATLEAYTALTRGTATTGNSGPFSGRLAGRIRPTRSVASVASARVS